MTRSESWKTDVAVNVALAAMASVSTDIISPKNWWPRCRAALEAAAGAADDWPGFVSRLASKLQVEVFARESTANFEIARETVGKDLAEFLAFVRGNAVYVVALAQMKRAAEREEQKGK